MRFNDVRLPLAGALLLSASALTFAFATNWGNGSSLTAAPSALIAVPSIAVVKRRVDDDRRAVRPADTRPTAAHIVAAHPAVAHPAIAHLAIAHPTATHSIPATHPIPAIYPVAAPTHLVLTHAPVPLPREPIPTVAPRKKPVLVAAAPSPALSSPLPGRRQPVSIVRFYGSAKTIARGDSVTLCARANGAAHLRLVPLGSLDPHGRNCRSFRPRQTTTYTLLAQSPTGDEVTQNVTIAVRKRQVPSPTPPPDEGP